MDIGGDEHWKAGRSTDPSSSDLAYESCHDHGLIEHLTFTLFQLLLRFQAGFHPRAHL